MTNRRFTPPWSIDESESCFVVSDHGGQKLTYFYFETEAGRRSAAKLLTRDSAVDDDDAERQAKALRKGFDIEIWEGVRLVKRLPYTGDAPA